MARSLLLLVLLCCGVCVVLGQDTQTQATGSEQQFSSKAPDTEAPNAAAAEPQPPTVVRKPETDEQTFEEELVSAGTHIIGFFLAIFGTAYQYSLAKRYCDAWDVASVTIFGSSLVLLYGCSTVYHSIGAFYGINVKNTFEYIDRGAIYLLLAGSYTPFCLGLLRAHRKRYTIWLLSVIWGTAFIGMTATFCLSDHPEYTHSFLVYEVMMYLLMGWFGAIGGRPIFDLMPREGRYWMILGGLSYTVGVGFFAWEDLPFHHAVWHVFVMFGSFGHYLSVLYSVILPKRDIKSRI
eukprot:gnl/Hemi2/20160_TR6684_c0_g1_i1.p1 gnl/Hemi2/20160_TR6684_c0_g1~~gnl/Hemi2/20160_TR6684_c0_g1_i1.p1  ORF type:complete len:293 (-),score=27.69 gnl/Hemi2/20160_TR6684_c0_g1_i1:43-921(-)